MRFVWTALVVLALSSPAKADECKIVWLDLFLPHSVAEFEKTSDVSGLLTLKDTSQLKPISFELALRKLTDEDGRDLEFLLGEQTLVSAGLSNQVTVTLQPKTNSWLVGFESKRAFRNKDGRTFSDAALLGGSLTCVQLKPW